MKSRQMKERKKNETRKDVKAQDIWNILILQFSE